MTFNVPPDLETLVNKHLATGAFENTEDVFRKALENMNAEETWTHDERRALDAKVARALEQVAKGETCGPDEARRRLAAMRARHLESMRQPA